MDREDKRGGLIKVGCNSGRLDVDGTVRETLGDESHEAGRTYDHQDAVDAVSLANELASELPGIYSLTDLRRIRRASYKARTIAAPIKAQRMALLVDSPVTRMLGNAYQLVSRPKCPIRTFTDEDVAIEWLKDGMNAGVE